MYCLQYNNFSWKIMKSDSWIIQLTCTQVHEILSIYLIFIFKIKFKNSYWFITFFFKNRTYFKMSAFKQKTWINNEKIGWGKKIWKPIFPVWITLWWTAINRLHGNCTIHSYHQIISSEINNHEIKWMLTKADKFLTKVCHGLDQWISKYFTPNT